MRAGLALAALVGAGAVLAGAPAGCRRESATGERASEPAPAVAVAAADAGRLPEDPEAGRRSEAQWREHLAFEERERQQGYDGRHLEEHRAVVKLITRARARIDGAKTARALAKARAATPATVAAIRRKLTAMDHWGVNSRLLPDYDAVLAALAGPYPDARGTALAGDAAAWNAARTDLDARFAKIAAWLDEVSAGDGDEEEDDDGGE